jgi:hypothetical protein
MAISPHVEDLKKAHMFQKSSNDCGPFCVAIALKAMKDINTNGFDVSEESNKIRWVGIFPIIRRIPNWATFPWGLVDLLRQHGTRSRWKIFNTQENLINILNKERIAIVLIGEWKHKWSHYKILVAIDEKLGLGFIDPGNSSSQISWQLKSDFIKQWRFLANSIIELEK